MFKRHINRFKFWSYCWCIPVTCGWKMQPTGYKCPACRGSYKDRKVIPYYSDHIHLHIFLGGYLNTMYNDHIIHFWPLAIVQSLFWMIENILFYRKSHNSCWSDHNLFLNHRSWCKQTLYIQAIYGIFMVYNSTCLRTLTKIPGKKRSVRFLVSMGFCSLPSGNLT